MVINNNWNLIKFTCQNCGKIIEAFPSQKRKFCSKCAKFRQVKKKCLFCDKEFLSDKAAKRQFCCYQCAMNNRKGKQRDKIIGEKIRKTKLKRVLTIPNSGRKRASYLYPIKPCELCGEDGSKRKIHRHHKDTDPLNNKKENIQFLCVLCHNRLHKNWMKKINN